jgi:hypothetical protein
MLAVIAWIGTACLALAPFLINYTLGKILAITGLALLTVQAYNAKLYNLVLLNSIGIIGYCYALYI